MSESIDRKPKCRSQFWLSHIVVGALVTIVALYMVITGEYSNLVERKQMENTLNLVALVGILYAVGSWYGYMFLCASSDKAE